MSVCILTDVQSKMLHTADMPMELQRAWPPRLQDSLTVRNVSGHIQAVLTTVSEKLLQGFFKYDFLQKTKRPLQLFSFTSENRNVFTFVK